MHGAARPTLWGWMRRVLLQTICWRKSAAGEAALVMKRSSKRKRRTKVLSTPSTFPLCALSRPVKTLAVGVLACGLFIWLKCWKHFQGNDFIIILCAFISLTRASRHRTSQRSRSSGLKIRLVRLDEFASEAFSLPLSEFHYPQTLLRWKPKAAAGDSNCKRRQGPKAKTQDFESSGCCQRNEEKFLWGHRATISRYNQTFSWYSFFKRSFSPVVAF